MTRARELADQHKTLDVDGGTIKLDGNYPAGTGNVALGDTALDSNVSGAANTAIGAEALTANTTANYNTAQHQLDQHFVKRHAAIFQPKHGLGQMKSQPPRNDPCPLV